MLDLSGFDRLSPDDIAYLDEHCHETGLPGQHRRAYLREHPEDKPQDVQER